MLRCRARSWHETELLQQSLISATGSERIRSGHLRIGSRARSTTAPGSSGISHRSALLWHHDQCRFVQIERIMTQTTATGFACPSCGKDMLYLAKLPAVGFRVAVQVFKCQTCITIISKEPEEVKHLAL